LFVSSSPATLTLSLHLIVLFILNATPTTPPYTLSLRDALPISCASSRWPIRERKGSASWRTSSVTASIPRCCPSASSKAERWRLDRKSTCLNSSHSQISYAVFCLKKKNARVRYLLTYHCTDHGA